MRNESNKGGENMREFLSTRKGQALSAFAIVAGVLLGSGGIAGATSTDPVTGAFSSAQTSMETYIGLGIGVIATILVLGIGVTVLVKYVRKAGRAA